MTENDIIRNCQNSFVIISQKTKDCGSMLIDSGLAYQRNPEISWVFPGTGLIQF